MITGSGRGSSASASVSPIVISGMPATEMISPGAGLVGVDAVERLGDVELGDLDPLDRAVGAAPGDRLAPADRAVADPADGQPADVGRGVEVGHVGLEGVVGVVLGRREALDDQVDQRREVGALDALLEATPSPPWRWCRRSGTRSGTRRRRGRGTARRPRRRPRRCGRRAGRPC